MPTDTMSICYASGEPAKIGDRIKNTSWAGTVVDVIATKAEMAEWGVKHPGLMIDTEAVSYVFEASTGEAWAGIVLEGRKK